MASHDLRNPISAIEMITDLLLEGLNDNLTEEQIEFLKEIKNSSEHMSLLLNDLLDITAIESGKLKLEITKQNYLDFIKNIIKFNKRFGDKKRINIELNYYEDIKELSFDKNKITQVINNLISNGIKYSYPDTKIIIKIKMENEYVITEVIDEGQGIPEYELKNIFKEFHKSSVKSTGGEQSTGLGLAIVKKIVEGHGGQIGVRSKVGQGSTFHYTLPVNCVMRDA
jgi:signal transduction histidine kinase